MVQIEERGIYSLFIPKSHIPSKNLFKEDLYDISGIRTIAMLQGADTPLDIWESALHLSGEDVEGELLAVSCIERGFFDIETPFFVIEFPSSSPSGFALFITFPSTNEQKVYQVNCEEDIQDRLDLPYREQTCVGVITPEGLTVYYKKFVPYSRKIELQIESEDEYQRLLAYTDREPDEEDEVLAALAKGYYESIPYPKTLCYSRGVDWTLDRKTLYLWYKWDYDEYYDTFDNFIKYINEEIPRLACAFKGKVQGGNTKDLEQLHERLMPLLLVINPETKEVGFYY